MALALANALVELSEATLATLPGSVGNPAGKKLVRSLTKEFQDFFRRLEGRFPMGKVRQFSTTFFANRPEDAEQSLEEKNKVAERVEGIITAAVGKSDKTLEKALGDHMAVGYMVAAGQIEASLRKEFKVQEAALFEASIEAQFLDQAIPTEVVDWANANAAQAVVGIAETTKRDLANTIATTLTQPRRGVPDVAQAIQNRFAGMSRARAELIATTEMNNAMSQGTLDRAASMGATKKEWITVGDDRVSELICEPNGGQGEIALPRTFQSGHERPSGHPRCRCALGTFGATRATVRAGVSEPGRDSWLSNIGDVAALAGGVRAVAAAAG